MRKRTFSIEPQSDSVFGKIRVANIAYLNSIPFRAVSSLDWIDYQEVSPIESSRRFFENTADFALVPLAELAGIGGFRLLHYGIVSVSPLDSVFLFSQCSLGEIETIGLDIDSHSSVMLLRVLLAEYYPELFKKVQFYRADASTLLSRISGRAAALVIGDAGMKSRGKFAEELDLSIEWRNRTGLPFLFSAWAVSDKYERIGDIRRFEGALELALRNRAVFAREWAEQQGINRDYAATYTEEGISYEIDEAAILGAEKFIELAAKHRQLPRTKLRFASFRPFTQLTMKPQDPRPELPNDILERIEAGERMSVGDMLELVQQTTIVDLSVIAERRHHAPLLEFDLVDINWFDTPSEEGLNAGLTEDRLKTIIQPLPGTKTKLIRLRGLYQPELGLPFVVEALGMTHGVCKSLGKTVLLSALSAESIAALADAESRPIREILTELAEAGLNILGGSSDELLLDAFRGRAGRRLISASDWINIHRTCHTSGLRSVASLPLAAHHSLRDRLMHLYKLRYLQNETNGFISCIVEPLSLPANSTITLLSSICIARIFLDNFDRIDTVSYRFGTPLAELALQFGADEFAVPAN